MLLLPARLKPSNLQLLIPDVSWLHQCNGIKIGQICVPKKYHDFPQKEVCHFPATWFWDPLKIRLNMGIAGENNLIRN